MSKKIYRVRARYLDHEGRGVVSFNHSMIPVEGLLPGELGEISLYRRKGETFGRLEALSEPSGQRQTQVCPYFEKCGGCQLWHMRYDAQLRFKQEQVAQLMGRDCTVLPVLGMESPLGYRHKVHATFGRGHGKKVIAGIYREGSHELIQIHDCLIQNTAANEVIAGICAAMEALNIAPYDEDTGRGLLRHVLIRVGHKTGQMMVVLVVSRFQFPQSRALCSRLLESFPQIRSIVYSLNPYKTSMVLGREFKTIYGDGVIMDELCGLKFLMSPSSFYQVNPAQTEILYTKAMEMAQITKNDRVLDTYCGTGTISLIAAAYAKSVTGVEQNPSAVADANANARNNHVKNVHFICEDATKYMERVAVDFEGQSDYNVVIMDPPRSGSSPRFLKALAKLAPHRVIYISCNPVTQKRDLTALCRDGYRIMKIQPVDMFPMTAGIENIVLLQYAPRESERQTHRPKGTARRPQRSEGRL